MTRHLNKTLLIANPVAQNGNGATAAIRAAELLGAALGDNTFSLALTSSPGHATELAAQAGDTDTVIALGGDGTIHEVANGLMRLPESTRPVFGVLPVGSGNDYARTLGMSFSLDEAVGQVLASKQLAIDVGCCNDVYFVETLSFGLDAAIAHETMERRQRTGQTGTMLYLTSGIDQLLHHLKAYPFCAVLDGGAPMDGVAYQFAVQVGPTYGGGFRICPEASPDDGLFDICVARPPLGVVRAACLFLMAKGGHHTKFKQISFYRAQSLHLSFAERPPVQIDGEPLVADEFVISVKPKALQVLVPAS